MPPMTLPGIDVDVVTSDDFLTAEAVAQAVNEIFAFVIYHRRQIPLPYRLFKHHVVHLPATEERAYDDERSRADVELDKGRAAARHTQVGILQMRQIVRELFDQRDVKALRLVFGTDPEIAKEAFTIHVPYASVRKDHLASEQMLSEARLSGLILSLLGSEQLGKTFDLPLPRTKVHLQFEALENDLPDDEEEEAEEENNYPDCNRLPRTCRITHIHLRHKPLEMTHSNGECDNRTVSVANEYVECRSVWYDTNCQFEGFQETASAPSIW